METIKASELTGEQLRDLAERGTPGKMASAAEEDLDGPEVPGDSHPDEDKQGVPAWYPFPAPKAPRGRQVIFLRFRAPLTDDPAGPDRYAACWNLTEADEKLAALRARGQEHRVMVEMAKQFVRVVDGQPADWQNGPACVVNAWWDAIGGKARAQVIGMYAKQHTMNTAEAIDFFASCVAVRTAAG